MTTEFTFRWPADMPEMTFEALAARLAALCDHGNCMSDVVQIGSTVKIRWYDRAHTVIMIRLYDTTIAILGSDGTVRFPNDDPHLTTTRWIAKIIADNGLGNYASRIRRRKADGPGPEAARGQAGMLVIDWDRSKPVHGQVHLASSRHQPDLSDIR
jgi:hypothetical protein